MGIEGEMVFDLGDGGVGTSWVLTPHWLSAPRLKGML